MIIMLERWCALKMRTNCLRRPSAKANRRSLSPSLLCSMPMDSSSSASTSGSSNPPQFPTSAAPSYFPLPFHLQNAVDPNALQQYPTSYYPQPPVAPLINVPTLPQTYATGVSTAPGSYALPQHQQAQRLFQRDAQTITPEALESVKAALASSEIEHKAETRKKSVPRKAAGQSWEDPTLADWPENDFRLFCGDLGNEVNDEILSKSFSRFPYFNMARVVRDKRTGKTRGYGFVSFSNPSDLAAAMKEMNGKYVGNRPIKLRKSTWKERTDVEALGRHKKQMVKKPKLPKKGILHK